MAVDPAGEGVGGWQRSGPARERRSARVGERLPRAGRRRLPLVSSAAGGAGCTGAAEAHRSEGAQLARAVPEQQGVAGWHERGRAGGGTLMLAEAPEQPPGGGQGERAMEVAAGAASAQQHRSREQRARMALGLLLAFVAFTEFLPSEPFLTQFLTSKGLTKEQVDHDLFSLWIYVRLPLLLVVGALAEHVGSANVLLLGSALGCFTVAVTPSARGYPRCRPRS
ncbi:unnamed protein product [Prorocentrum cordatum]|uniref:Solute carrier family 40 protein n=1 Tax=Prorocentrum cordatum TaxID=2364126 RepID=A0ABN9PMT0_9DINO|nr:unnamed protein product [Polarella glacialis]